MAETFRRDTVAKPSRYIALTSGFQISSTFSARFRDVGFPLRGSTKSSVGANCARLTSRDDYFLRAAAREPHQRHMSVIKRSHRRTNATMAFGA